MEVTPWKSINVEQNPLIEECSHYYLCMASTIRGRKSEKLSGASSKQNVSSLYHHFLPITGIQICFSTQKPLLTIIPYSIAHAIPHRYRWWTVLCNLICPSLVIASTLNHNPLFNRSCNFTQVPLLNYPLHSQLRTAPSKRDICSICKDQTFIPKRNFKKYLKIHKHLDTLTLNWIYAYFLPWIISSVNV